MNRPEGMEALVLSEEEVALPSTVDGVLEVLRKVLSKPFVQSVILRSGSPISVTWYKDLSDTLSIGEPEEDPDSVLSRVDLEEFASSKSPREAFVESIFYLNQQNFHATHVFVGSIKFFKDWQSIPSVTPLPRMEGTKYYNYLSMNLVEVGSLENDVVVVLASDSKGSSTTELKKALKIST